MAKLQKPSISLEDAKKLVSLLEADDQDGASDLLETVSINNSIALFSEVGKLTRQLHDSLNNFQLDARIADLAKEDIPDAQTRLNYVIDTTEQAANRTMDAVDTCMPIAEKMSTSIENILPEWKKLMTRQLELNEFKTLCYDLDNFLENSRTDSEKLNSLLTEVLMAQGYQDITGQVIRRVMELVKEVEDSLVHMLTVFSMTDVADLSAKKDKDLAESSDNMKAEGPIINPETRDDVVTGQDDVDDLLSSLGF
ncbi:protein phosphatase CheZ [Neptunicella marina]|uniref:Protein phosphatase CheZ n=1 Tax=Neptunicella marina TaxID=2125989 RepID=A0A8J6IML4_9ALTE|nr:protein phosphatase CheZ [Neptunicella marina]MBC3764980.1 protein phosphatase CheZ [Neptunicella marina]